MYLVAQNTLHLTHLLMNSFHYCVWEHVYIKLYYIIYVLQSYRYQRTILVRIHQDSIWAATVAEFQFCERTIWFVPNIQIQLCGRPNSNKTTNKHLAATVATGSIVIARTIFYCVLIRRNNFVYSYTESFLYLYTY